MAEPTIPAGFTIAWVVLNLVGWYGGWRKGLELIRQDIKAYKTAHRDLEIFLDNLDSQKEKVESWRKLWWIPDPETEAPESDAQEKKRKRKSVKWKKGNELSIRKTSQKGPPDEFFKRLWGNARYMKIKRRLEQLKSLFEEKEARLSPYMRLEEERKQISTLRRTYLKIRFVFWDRGTSPGAEIIENHFPTIWDDIQTQALEGWEEQREGIIREFEESVPESQIGRLRKLHPYHVLMAYSLAKIAGGTAHGHGAEELRRCSQLEAVREKFVIIVDVDVFKLAASPSDGKDLGNALQYVADLKNIRWKVDLLLREAEKLNEQFVRVEFERSAGTVTLESRISDAFTKVMSYQEDTAYFTANGTARQNFGLTKVRGGESLRFPSTIRDHLSTALNGEPPTANELDLDHPTTHRARLLPEVSTYRAAFELAQATLLFLRTSWLGDLCRCAVRTGSGTGLTHHTGIEMTCPAHKLRPWQYTDGEGTVKCIKRELECTKSWCSTHYDWDDANKPPRRLGLLLIELALGTAVMPSLLSDPNGLTCQTRKVENISVLVSARSKPDEGEWKQFTRDRVLSIAKRRSFNDNDDFQHAVEYCLTERFSQSPIGENPEFHLRKFYFRVVKPLRDMYARKFNGGNDPKYFLKQ